MSSALNVVEFGEAAARVRASKNIPKEEEVTLSSQRVRVSDKVKQIQNRIFRWKVTAFDLDFGHRLLQLNDPRHVAEILRKLNWSSYDNLSPRLSDKTIDNSSGIFSLNGWIHEWKIIDYFNQLGENKPKIFVEILSSEVFEKPEKLPLTYNQ